MTPFFTETGLSGKKSKKYLAYRTYFEALGRRN